MLKPVGRRVVIWRTGLLPASETFIRNQGTALRDWRPTFLGAVKVPSPIADPTDAITYPPSVRGRCSYLLLRLTGGSPALRRRLTRLRPDVVHAHFAGDGWLVSRTAARAGIPLIITLHGLDVTRQADRSGPRGRRYRRNLRTAFHRAALILAVSEFIRNRAIDLGADPATVRVHHTGVPIPPAPADVPKQWDVLFVGRFVAKKGLDDLVEALARITPPPRALFIGAGPLDAVTRRRAAELGLDATFLGVQDPAAVARHMSASKILVAPSKTAPDGDSEGLPTTILEAASLGIPTVSTVHSGIPEAVRHGETGLLGAEGDRTALAANIQRLLTDDELRIRLGHQARQHVETHFDLDRQTHRLEQLYTSVTGT